MRASFRAKQVAGVTLLVGCSMAVLSAFHLASLARVGLQESRARGDLLMRTLYEQTRQVVDVSANPTRALPRDRGIRSLLESSVAYSKGVIYAAITDPQGVAIAHSFASLEGRPLGAAQDLERLIESDTVAQLRAIYSDRTLEIEEPLLLGDTPFGSIRIGLSPVLLRDDLQRAVRPIAATTAVLLVLASLVAMALASWILRPIHVIATGLNRLGRGEFGVTLDLPPGEDFASLDDTFKAISARLARHDAGDDRPHPDAHDLRTLASLGRLLAGVAHEVKNPLNAMTIHAELIRQKLEPLAEADRAHASDQAPLPAGSALKHLSVISNEIKRLDQAIQGFLRFIRPEVVSRRPVALADLGGEVLALVEPDARRTGVVTELDCPASLPDLDVDATLLRQALLNLALNACQAMPQGGRLRVSGRQGPRGRVWVDVSDTGGGIPADQLDRIFDLYYTTKEGGSGIGLPMVYRIVLLHGGDIEVESTPGVGTRFRLSLPQAPPTAAGAPVPVSESASRPTSR